MSYLIPVDVTILRVYILKECNAIGANKEIHYRNSISKKLEFITSLLHMTSIFELIVNKNAFYLLSYSHTAYWVFFNSRLFGSKKSQL